MCQHDVHEVLQQSITYTYHFKTDLQHTRTAVYWEMTCLDCRHTLVIDLVRLSHALVGRPVQSADFTVSHSQHTKRGPLVDAFSCLLDCFLLIAHWRSCAHDLDLTLTRP